MVRDAFGRAGMRVGYLWDCLDGIGLGWLGVVLVLAWGGLGWLGIVWLWMTWLSSSRGEGCCCGYCCGCFGAEHCPSVLAT